MKTYELDQMLTRNKSITSKAMLTGIDCSTVAQASGSP